MEHHEGKHEVKVGASPVRCPFCHEHVAPGDPALVACGGCLARHHDACWDERGACSSCGAVQRLVADARTGPSDHELVELLRSGDHARATAALRARGLDERAARVALDLVAAALAPTSDQRTTWLITAVVFAFQGVALLTCGGLALANAEVGAVSGGLVMLAVVAALMVVAAMQARGVRRWALLGLALANLAAFGLGPAVVTGANIPASVSSPELLLLGLLLGGASLGVATLAAKSGVRRPQALRGASSSTFDGSAGGGAGSRRP